MGTGLYAFSHLTFQEYLAAREIVDNRSRQNLLLETAGDEWWQEVTLLYAGMTDATAIIDALIATEEDEGCARLLLAGRCVAEAVRVEPPTRERVMRGLEQNFATCTGDLFLRTGQVLADIAGEDSVDFFLHLARDDPKRREAALWSLGQMGRQPNDTLRERVLEQLIARFRGKELRRQSAAALAQVWGVKTSDELRKRQVPTELLEQSDSTLAETIAEMMDSMTVHIPASEFLMGDEQRTIRVDTFRIDKYPVTNAQYKRFVEATDHPPPGHWGGGTYPAGKALHPVVYVSWDDAVAYAEWAGKRLPTEEEWEKAARGTAGREYPWGDWEEGRCNTGETGIRDTTPVGQYSPGGDSPYGCADMAGNVWEWTLSLYEPGKPYRVVRGGSWFNDQENARCGARDWLGENHSYSSRGFRCVSPVS